MAALKNLRQERFLREYVKGISGAEAYRRAYPNADPVISAKRNAWILLNKRPKVQRRFKELVDTMIKRADITMDKILGDYQRAMEMAESERKPGDITNAATAQAKLVGLLRDRVEAGNVGDFDNVEDISAILEIVAKEGGSELATKLAAICGLETAPAPSESQIEASELEQAKPASDAMN